jgi:hypothetical protein
MRDKSTVKIGIKAFLSLFLANNRFNCLFLFSKVHSGLFQVLEAEAKLFVSAEQSAWLIEKRAVKSERGAKT